MSQPLAEILAADGVEIRSAERRGAVLSVVFTHPASKSDCVCTTEGLSDEEAGVVFAMRYRAWVEARDAELAEKV
jgi:hypothetical protein